MNLHDDDPAGAVFRRCALQVNSHHYGGKFRGQELGGDERSHADAIVARAIDLEVSVLAVTDHNDVSSVGVFRDAAAGRNVTVFPGFELSSAEGIHVLCIYPPETDEEQLGRYLGSFGIHRTEPSSDLSGQPLEVILAMVREQGGISVAAHVTNDKGLFKALSGKARIKAWRSEHLLAIQIPSSIEALPQDVRQIVLNKNTDYRRSRPAGSQLAVAAINAKDIYKPEHLEDPSASCLIKMSDVSIEGLRQAFMDPDSRVRLVDDAEEMESQPGGELLGVCWEGGFLDGTEVRLNPNLNVLIGGRGTGKSTIVESVRYALGVEPVGEQALQSHQGIVRQVLRNGTKVSVGVRCHRPIQRDYLIERIVPHRPIVRDGEGHVSNLRPEEILPGIEVYGQHEISELTRSPEKLTRLLDRFVVPDRSLSDRKNRIRQELAKSRRTTLDVRAELDHVEETLATLPGLEETLEQFREAGLEVQLRERSLLVREERVLDLVPERLESFHRQVNAIRHELPIDRAFISAAALSDLPGKDILGGLNQILERLGSDIEEAVQRLIGALERADASILELRTRWGNRAETVQAAYQKILRAIDKAAVEAEEFIDLQRRIEELRPLRERRALLENLERSHLERRRQLLADWQDLQAEEFRRLDRAARKVTKALDQRVQVDVVAAGDREPFYRLIRAQIGGRLAETVASLAASPEFSPSVFVDTCRAGSDAIEETFEVPRGQAQRLADAPVETLMEIEELELPPAATIRLNTATALESPVWQALNDLSMGQKATAVLLLLLLESDSPLIVDQPEDDLDNRFITEGIIPKMRSEKQRRQFVFSTHNANIPVLGDAELILGLTASGEAGSGNARIASEHVGSIDAGPVRELVEELLEGGKDAFETRRLKYGF